MRQKAAHGALTDGDAACCRIKLRCGNFSPAFIIARAGDMEKYRRAAAAYARADIPVQREADIIEIIIAPQTFRAGGIRQAHGAIIIAVMWIIAPAVIFAHAGKRHGAGRQSARAAFAEAADNPHSRQRCGAISLALESADAALPQSAGNAQRPRLQNAAAFIAAKRADKNFIQFRVRLHYALFRIIAANTRYTEYAYFII